MKEKNWVGTVIIIICLFITTIFTLASLNSVKELLKNQSSTEPTTIIIKNEAVPTEVVKEEPAVSVEPVEVPEMKTMVCPYCHEGLSTFSSSYLTSVAQMRCYHCGYCSPEVKSDKPDAEMKCIEILKDRLMNGGWSEHDFTGE